MSKNAGAKGVNGDDIAHAVPRSAGREIGHRLRGGVVGGAAVAAHAKDNSGLGLMERQRLKMWLAHANAEIDRVGV